MAGPWAVYIRNAVAVMVHLTSCFGTDPSPSLLRRDKLIDQVVELDDDVLTAYFEGEMPGGCLASA